MSFLGLCSPHHAHVRGGSTVEEAALNVKCNAHNEADIHLFKAIKLMKGAEVLEACKQYIEAAMQSTAAFHGMPDRLIVIDIHGKLPLIREVCGWRTEWNVAFLLTTA